MLPVEGLLDCVGHTLLIFFLVFSAYICRRFWNVMKSHTLLRSAEVPAKCNAAL